MTSHWLQLFKSASRLAVAAALVCAFLPVRAHAQGLTWTIGPYLWGANVTARADVNEADALDRTRAFGSTIDETDFMGSVYAEVHGQKWGLFTDISFINLGDQTALVEAVPAPSGVIIVTPESVVTDLKLTTIDAAVLYRPGGGPEGLDVYFGVRIADVDQKFDAVYPNESEVRVYQIDENFWNGIAGVRYVKSFSEKWDVAGRIDAGAGDSDLTWNAQATAGYWFGDSRIANLRFGWRYTEMKFERDVDVAGLTEPVNIDSKLELNGPIVGVLFRF